MYNIKSLIFILILMLLPGMKAKAQITIESTDLQSAGDTVRISNALVNPLIDFTTTGPNITWDYSNLTWNTQEVDSFVTVSSTGIVYSVVFVNIPLNPNRANIAELNLLPPIVPGLTITNAVGFYYKTSSLFEQAGYGAELNGTPTAVPFDNRDRIYNFPLNYNDEDSSESNYSIGIPTLGFYAHEQKRVNKVDGWGTVTTPYGTFDALRVRSVITGRDSIYVNATGIGFSTDTPVITEYKWLAKQKDLPVLEITTTNNFGTEIVSGVRYIDSVRTNTTGIWKDQPLSDFMAVPNPVTDHLMISFISDATERNVVLHINTVSGQQVHRSELNITNGVNKILVDGSISNLEPGIYFLSLQGNGWSVRQKFVKQ